MTAEELDALPVVMPFEVACRALSLGRNQGYRLLREGKFPVRVLTLSGRHKVSRFDLMRFLGAYSPDVLPAGESAGQDTASGHAAARCGQCGTAVRHSRQKTPARAQGTGRMIAAGEGRRQEGTTVTDNITSAKREVLDPLGRDGRVWIQRQLTRPPWTQE